MFWHKFFDAVNQLALTASPLYKRGHIDISPQEYLGAYLLSIFTSMICGLKGAYSLGNQRE